MKKILQINTSDMGGGAEGISWALHQQYSKQISSWLIVGQKKTLDANTFRISNFRDRDDRNRILQAGLKRFGTNSKAIKYLLRALSLDWRAFLRWVGIEDFHYPESRELLQRVPGVPDIVHLHNIHGGYFDLRCLPQLSHEAPVVVTLHDEWLFTGHCAHSLDCTRWETGCGQCPDLDRYPPIHHDMTAWNYRRKKIIYEKSILFLVAPSRWLMDRAQKSVLQTVFSRVIHNGIDQNVFRPASKEEAKAALNINTSDPVFLFVANRGRENLYKDYDTIDHALKLFEGKGTFISLGAENSASSQRGNITYFQVPFQTDPSVVARYYQAADVYLHAAHADTFPTVILEALSCGTPVIATDIGGIPEQIRDGETGFLVPAGDAAAMAEKINTLVNYPDLRRQLAVQAAQDASLRFGVERMVNEYLDFYQEVVAVWKERRLQ